MLQLTDFRKQFTFRLQKNMLEGNLKDQKGGKHKYGKTFDFDVFLPTYNCNLQRPKVWTLQQKQELVLSMLKGIDIQAISVIQSTGKDKNVTIKVIDGKQRLTTMLDFLDNEFPIIAPDGLEYYFRDLPAELKNVIEMYDLNFNQTYEYWDDLISDDDKIAWFEQINFA